MMSTSAVSIPRPTAALLSVFAVAMLALLAASAPWALRQQLNAANAGQQQVLDNLTFNLARVQEKLRENGGATGQAATGGEVAPLLLSGETTGIAGAALQERLTGLLAAGRTRAESYRVLAPVDDSGLIRIGVVVSARFDTVGLRDFLFAVEKERPLLIIDALQIRTDAQPGVAGSGVAASGVAGSGVAGSGGGDAREQLSVSIEVHGFMAPEGAI